MNPRCLAFGLGCLGWALAFASGSSAEQPALMLQQRQAFARGLPAEPNRPDALERAEKIFQRAVVRRRLGRAAAALSDFERSHALWPTAQALFEIARANVQLGRYAEARRALESYRAQFRERLPERRRRELDHALQGLASRTARLWVDANVPGAELLVDGVVTGTLPLQAPVLLDVGTHTVVVRSSGYLPAASRLTLSGGQLETLDVQLGAALQEASFAPHQPAGRRSLLIAGWVTTGALAAGAIVSGIVRAGEVSELEELQSSSGNRDVSERLREIESHLKSLAVAAEVLSGAALVVGGLSLWVTLRPSSVDSVLEDSQARPHAPALEIGYQQGQLKLRGSF